MAFFTKSTKAEDVKDGGNGGKYISKSGLYDVTILVPFVSQGNDQATAIDLFINYNGQDQVIYGNMSYTNKDGGANEIGQKTFNKLVAVSYTHLTLPTILRV